MNIQHQIYIYMCIYVHINLYIYIFTYKIIYMYILYTHIYIYIYKLVLVLMTIFLYNYFPYSSVLYFIYLSLLKYLEIDCSSIMDRWYILWAIEYLKDCFSLAFTPKWPHFLTHILGSRHFPLFCGCLVLSCLLFSVKKVWGSSDYLPFQTTFLFSFCCLGFRYQCYTR